MKPLHFCFAIILPFLVLMLVAFFTQPEDKERLDQFYGKMLTPVVGTPDDDEREMALTRSNPTRFNHLKIFPDSNWEFRRLEPRRLAGRNSILHLRSLAWWPCLYLL